MSNCVLFLRTPRRRLAGGEQFSRRLQIPLYAPDAARARASCRRTYTSAASRWTVSGCAAPMTRLQDPLTDMRVASASTKSLSVAESSSQARLALRVVRAFLDRDRDGLLVFFVGVVLLRVATAVYFLTHLLVAAAPVVMLASGPAISCLTSNASRRVVGQWGSARGACCEDHLAFAVSYWVSRGLVLLLVALVAYRTLAKLAEAK